MSTNARFSAAIAPAEFADHPATAEEIARAVWEMAPTGTPLADLAEALRDVPIEQAAPGSLGEAVKSLAAVVTPPVYPVRSFLVTVPPQAEARQFRVSGVILGAVKARWVPRPAPAPAPAE